MLRCSRSPEGSAMNEHHDFNRRARALRQMAAQTEADPEAIARYEAHRAAMLAVPMDFILPVCGVTAGEATKDDIVTQFCHPTVRQLSVEQCEALSFRLAMLTR